MGIFQIALPVFTIAWFILFGIDPILLIGGIALGYIFFILTMAGYHRILAHKIVQTPQWFKALYSFIGCLSFSSPPISWASTHILHHMFSDTEKDPHSPIYLGPIKSSLFYFQTPFGEIMNKLTLREKKRFLVAIKHLVKDPMLIFFEKNYLVLTLMYVILLAIISPALVIYAYCIPVIYSHFGALLVVTNHNGVFGGESSSDKHRAFNKFILWPLVYGEHNHSDHHDAPGRADGLNNLLRRLFGKQGKWQTKEL
tara:strand:+ start:275 stop:1039 length:765 start_codon:yes stop_codon:yes gene_type:complete